MNIIIPFLTFFLCYLANAKTCFSECKQISNHNCSICYSKCFDSKSQLTNFRILKCSMTILDNDDTQVLALNQIQCGVRCCQQSSRTPFTSENLDRCVFNNQLLKNQSTVVTIIILSSVGSFICLIFFLCCLYAHCKKKNIDLGNQNSQLNDRAYEGENKLTWKTLADQRQHLESLWDQQKNLQQNCSICLDPLCDCQTQCGHLYHTKCLLEWLKRDRICPDCRSTKTKLLRIICLKCKSMYLTVRSPYHMQELKTLINANKLNCEKCSNRQATGNESFEGGWIDNFNH